MCPIQKETPRRSKEKRRSLQREGVLSVYRERERKRPGMVYCGESLRKGRFRTLGGHRPYGSPLELLGNFSGRGELTPVLDKDERRLIILYRFHYPTVKELIQCNIICNIYMFYYPTVTVPMQCNNFRGRIV